MNNKGIIRFCQWGALVLSSEYRSRLTIFTKEYSPRLVGSEVSRKLYHLIIWGSMMMRSKLVGPVLSEILTEEMEFHFSGSLLPPPPLYQPKPSLWERNGGNICMLAPQVWNVLPTQASLPLLTFPTATSKEPSRKLPTFSGIDTRISLTIMLTAIGLEQSYLSPLPNYTLC